MPQRPRIRTSPAQASTADLPLVAREQARGLEVASRWRWLKLLVLGAAVWVVAVVVLAVTRDPNLIPLTVVTGSFTVPVAGAVYVRDRLFDSAFPSVTILDAFVVGGTFGVLLAAAGEYALLGSGPLEFGGVGLIEEASKLLALWIVARRLGTYSARDGIVLGASVGFGFAALESSGYALVSLFGSSGLALPNMVSTVVERGVLAPFGHGLWTGILGGVLFMSAREGRLRLTPIVVAAYLFVALLHSLFDSSSTIAALVVSTLSGHASDWRQLARGEVPAAMEHDLTLFMICSIGCIVVVSILGISAMVRLWRVATR